MDIQPVLIGERPVGPGAPVFVIAEAGVNHDGDPAAALELVDAAARAGADAVKFQSFDPDGVVVADVPLATYQREGEPSATNQLDMLRRLTLDREDHAAIASRCREKGIVFLSSPADGANAAMLVELGVPALKVGSGELNNLPFLGELARYGLPVLLSTGMGDLEEVVAAVEVIQRRGAPLVLLHCTSSYPAPPQDANLRAIDTLRRRFGVPVGYSDHCLGAEVSLAAVARDACILERHLTLDHARPGPDHAMSLEPEQLRDLVARVRALETSLGDGRKRPQPSERELRVYARRSIVAARPLAVGDVLTADSLSAKRPGDGLGPALLPTLIGRRVTRPLAVDEQLATGDVDPPA